MAAKDLTKIKSIKNCPDSWEVYHSGLKDNFCPIRRLIFLTGDIDEARYSELTRNLTSLENTDPNGEITIDINCSGGTVYDALAIIGRLRQSSCPIRTRGFGCIMSAATLIFLSGDTREISPYADFMYHQSQITLEGTYSLRELIDFVDQKKKEEDNWARWMAKFTGKKDGEFGDYKYWKELASDGKDKHLTPDELLELGVAHRKIKDLYLVKK